MAHKVQKIGCPACGPERPPSPVHGPGCEQCNGSGWVYQVPNTLSLEEIKQQIAEIEAGESGG